MQLLAGVGISAAAVQEPELSSRQQQPCEWHFLGAVSHQSTDAGNEFKNIFNAFWYKV